MVDAIDSFTTGVNGSGLKTAQVNYHYSFPDVPAWAKSQEVQTAFSSVGLLWRTASRVRIRWS